MGIFGWSLPPGCGTLPGEEECASELTQYVKDQNGGKLPAGVLAVWWDEYGEILETIDCNGECDEARVGLTVEWQDEDTEKENFEWAARKYLEHRRVNP